MPCTDVFKSLRVLFSATFAAPRNIRAGVGLRKCVSAHDHLCLQRPQGSAQGPSVSATTARLYGRSVLLLSCQGLQVRQHTGQHAAYGAYACGCSSCSTLCTRGQPTRGLCLRTTVAHHAAFGRPVHVPAAVAVCRHLLAACLWQAGSTIVVHEGPVMCPQSNIWVFTERASGFAVHLFLQARLAHCSCSSWTRLQRLAGALCWPRQRQTSTCRLGKATPPMVPLSS